MKKLKDIIREDININLYYIPREKINVDHLREIINNYNFANRGPWCSLDIDEIRRDEEISGISFESSLEDGVYMYKNISMSVHKYKKESSLYDLFILTDPYEDINTIIQKLDKLHERFTGVLSVETED